MENSATKNTSLHDSKIKNTTNSSDQNRDKKRNFGRCSRQETFEQLYRRVVRQPQRGSIRVRQLGGRTEYAQTEYAQKKIVDNC